MALGLGFGLSLYDFAPGGIGPIGPVGTLDFTDPANSALTMGCGFFGV